jgi:betaine lipid synthase
MLGLSAYLPLDPFQQLTLAVGVVGIFLATIFAFAFRSTSDKQATGSLQAYLKFIYGCFLKPHTGDGTGNQQDALVCLLNCYTRHRANCKQESFYKAQADVYDATRVRLLRGREDMLGLVAAQLKHRTNAGLISQRPVWVDVSFRNIHLSHG